MNEKEFAFILDKGEDFKIEFRENVPGMEKDIVAFANAEGGTILLGVDDKKKIKGLALTNKIKSEIQDIARNCDPAISIDVSSFDNVLIVTVPESVNKPHRCSTGFYLRQGASSQKLTVAEIRELFSKQGKLLFEEMINKEFAMADFDKKKFEVYLKKTNISKVLPEKNLLRNMGILTEKEQFKNAGILMFAKEPATFIPQNVITCVLYKGKNKAVIIDRKDFASDLINNYENTVAFLYRNLKLRYEFEGFGPRKEILEIPEKALKEAVINAICHRDYSENGAVIQVDIFDDRAEISNPGGLIIKESEFGKRSLSRNPHIFGFMQRLDLVEHVGSGIERMRNEMSLARLPEPVFEFGTFFAVTFKRPAAELGVNLGEKLGVNQEKILSAIAENSHITIIELAKKTKISTTAVENNLAKLKEAGIIRRIGSPKKGYWEIVRKSSE